ncbi:hypothetical protein GBA52_024551 [Prunus armeniaca]|nr:hypothetical protein GBA52_024551 [Prunus armeniaca]
MENGSLDQWLHPRDDEQSQPKRLSPIQRLNIAIDVASALDYLHHHCETAIVHCDLKPSNVLLDEDMVAHVGDFGLARFLLQASNDPTKIQTMSVGLKGSIGYIPPGINLKSSLPNNFLIKKIADSFFTGQEVSENFEIYKINSKGPSTTTS